MTPPPPDDHTPALDAGHQHAEVLRTDLVRGSLWTFVGNLIAMPVSLVGNLIVVRALGRHEFARFAVLSAAYLVVITVASVGVGLATTQELAVARAKGDEARAEELIRRCGGFYLFVFTPVSLVAAIVLLHGSSLPIVITGAVCWGVAGMLAPTLTVLSGSGANATVARSMLAMAVLGQALMAITAIVTQAGDVTWAVRLASYCIAPGTALFALRPADRRALCRPKISGRGDRRFWTTALAFWVLAVTGLLLIERTEIFVLNWAGDVRAVAVFALATTVMGQLTAPMDAVMGPLAPTSAGLIADDPATGARLITGATTVAAYTGAFTTAVLLPAAVILVPVLFGSAYGGVVAVLVVLGVLSSLDSSLTPVRALAFGVMAAQGALRVTIVALVVDAVLAVTLIPPIGLAGAVLALTTGRAVFSVAIVRLVAARVGVRVRAVASAVRLAVLAVPLVVLALLVSAPIEPPIARAAAAALIGAATLFVVVRLDRGSRLPAATVDRLLTALPRRAAGPLRAVLGAVGAVERAAVPANEDRLP